MFCCNEGLYLRAGDADTEPPVAWATVAVRSHVVDLVFHVLTYFIYINSHKLHLLIAALVILITNPRVVERFNPSCSAPLRPLGGAEQLFV